MPNWKKVIVSGSNATLNSLNVTTNVVAQSFTGSLLGTSSFANNATSASFAATASYINGYANNGIEDYIPIWQNSGSLAKSIIFQKGNNTIGINRVNATTTLDVLSNGGGNTIANFETNVDSDVYIQLKNNVGYGYIGVNNKDFWFQPQGSTKAVLSASGEFGLGTSTPKYILDVVGSGNFSANLTATGSIKFPSLANTNQVNVVGYNTSTGQLFYQTTSSLSVTTASYALTASHGASGFTIGISQIKTATVTSSTVGSNNLFTDATGSFSGAKYLYTVVNGANARTGEVMAVWNGGSVQFTDNSTLDIGATTAVTASVSIVSAQAQFNIQTNTSGWTLKSTVTYI